MLALSSNTLRKVIWSDQSVLFVCALVLPFCAVILGGVLVLLVLWQGIAIQCSCKLTAPSASWLESRESRH